MRDDEHRLKLAIHRHGRGSAQARDAAINLCRSAGIDAHYRTATQPKVSPQFTECRPLAPTFFEEWQRVISTYEHV
jgi:hypothetical protein